MEEPLSEQELISKLKGLPESELKKLSQRLTTVPEIEILISCVMWLYKNRDVLPHTVSMARGKDINFESHKARFIAAIESVGIPIPRFKNDGPDIIGASKNEYWQVECKGFGIVAPQTMRNNFDRALASVVSYYTDDVMNKQTCFLGLALPDATNYMSELRRRVKKPLRRALNLWILLYEQATKQIRPVAPNDEY
jgi:hypothetical protein